MVLEESGGEQFSRVELAFAQEEEGRALLISRAAAGLFGGETIGSKIRWER